MHHEVAYDALWIEMREAGFLFFHSGQARRIRRRQLIEELPRFLDTRRGRQRHCRISCSLWQQRTIPAGDAPDDGFELRKKSARVFCRMHMRPDDLVADEQIFHPAIQN